MSRSITLVRSSMAAVSRRSPSQAARSVIRAASARHASSMSMEKPKVIGDVNETPEIVAKDLAKLFDEEIAVRADDESQAPEWEVASQWLKDSGFKVTETKEGLVTLSKKVNNTVVSASFNMYEEVEEGEEGEEGPNFDEDNEEEDQENEEGEEQGTDGPEKVAIEVKVSYNDRAGKTKGEFLFRSIARKDNRLYGDELLVSEGVAESEESLKGIDWWSLDDSTQDRVYDYLETFGVGDELAHFAKQYTMHAKTEHEVDFLKTFKGILSSKA